MKRKTEVRKSSGNIFQDLEVSSPDEVHAKAELTARIADIISSRGLSQAAAAKVLHIDQPKVSALLRGRLSGFSTERLMKFLTALGRDVEIVVRTRSAHARGHGHIQVLSA